MKNPKNAKSSGDDQKPTGRRGRKPDTPEQKAAKAAAKAAAKTAEKQATGEKRQEAAAAAIGHNSADPRARAIFLDALPKVKRLKERSKSVNGELRALYKDLQRDGFTKDQFETAILCETPEGEAKVQAKIAGALRAAQFVGAMLGKDLEMFDAPDRTPAADRAYDEGQKASMENKAALPPYAPETEQYRRYMAGFHDHQASIAAKGLKQINPPSAPPVSEVASGQSMTRQDMIARGSTPGLVAPDGTGAEHDSDDDDGEEFADRSAA